MQSAKEVHLGALFNNKLQNRCHHHHDIWFSDTEAVFGLDDSSSEIDFYGVDSTSEEEDVNATMAHLRSLDEAKLSVKGVRERERNEDDDDDDEEEHEQEDYEQDEELSKAGMILNPHYDDNKVRT